MSPRRERRARPWCSAAGAGGKGVQALLGRYWGLALGPSLILLAT